MQSAGLPAVEYEKKLIASTPKSVLFGAVIATNLQQAVALEQQLTNLPAVASVDSITSFLSEDQTNKLAVVGEIKQELASIRFGRAGRQAGRSRGAERNALLLARLPRRGAGRRCRRTTPTWCRSSIPCEQAIEALRKEMLRGDTNQVAANAAQAGRVPTGALQRRPRHVRGLAEPGQPRPAAAWRICRRRCATGSSASPASTC